MAEEEGKKPVEGQPPAGEAPATPPAGEQKPAAPDASKEDLSLGDEAAAAPVVELGEADPVIFVGRTGDAKVDEVGQLLAESGIESANDIIANYAKTGEVSLADQAAIISKLGDSVGSLVLGKLNDVAVGIREQGQVARKEVLDYANTKFGGEDANQTWAEIQAYVKDPESGFTAADRAAMTKMLKAGGLQARLVIDNVASAYAKDSNTSVPADLLTGDTLVQGGFEPLSSKEYSVKVNEATTKYGYNSNEVQQLKQRRERSIANGIA